MGYRYLGNTGIKVSIIGFGSMSMNDLGVGTRDEESQRF